MKIAITGANGYIGKNISNKLENEGHSVLSVSKQMLYGAQNELADFLSGADVVINLAGAPILQRWTAHNKIIIYNSRVLTTKKICEAINSLPESKCPKTFISASAVGIYQSDIIHDESSTDFAANFVGRVVLDWEDASLGLKKSIRRVVFRIGVVLGKESQTIKTMLPIFKLGLGGKVGSGQQAFPFIHINDVIKAFAAAISEEHYKGIFNLVSPEQISNKQFSKLLASSLNKPALFRIPPFVLKILYGEASEILLGSPKIIPDRLTKMGFSFGYPSIKSALEQITS